MKQDTPTIMLFWVKAEIDHALKGIREKIARYAAAPGDVAPLRACPEQLHQIAGALRIFDLMGVLRFTEAIEAALAKVISSGESKPKTIELLDRAVVALGEFVDGLSKGALNAPLRLFGLYKDLSALVGNTRVSRRDLFFPDSRIAPPRHVAGLVLAATALPPFLQTQRARYQRGLLTWLRDPKKPDGLQEMRQALDALDQVAPQLPEPQGMWWSAAGLIDGLMNAPRPDWAAMAKVICTKLDFQIRNLAAGIQQLDQQLLRDILYALTAARPTAPRMGEVRERYNLDSLLPGPDAEYAMDAHPEWRQAALGEVRTRLESIKGTWIEYVSSKPQQLARFRELVTALKAKANELGSQPLVRLLEVVGVVSKRLPDPYPRDSQLMAMEMASAFLLVESIVEQFNELPPDIDQQIVIMNGWLLDAAQNKTVCEPPAGLRADLIQKYNETHLQAQVAREILANLQNAEEALDAFARNPSRLDTLTDLAPIFKQIHGALIVLGYRRASILLAECEKLIAEALLPEREDTLKDIHWIAEGLSTLGVYLEPCLRGRAPVDQRLQRFLERYHKRNEDAGTTADEVSKPADPIRKKKQVLRPAPAKTAQASVSPAVAAPPAAAATTDAASKEMLEVFLEEAEEVLTNIRAAHAQCTQHTANHDALTIIRRGFHTLKGSGRMVALTDLGEVAWKIEQVMNRWLEHQYPATPALLDLIASATAAFADWVAQLKAGKTIKVEADAIVRAAQRLRASEAVATAPASILAAVAASPAPLPETAPAAAERVAAASAPSPQPAPTVSAEILIPPAASPAPEAVEAAGADSADIEIPTLDPAAFHVRFGTRAAAAPTTRASSTVDIPDTESADASAPELNTLNISGNAADNGAPPTEPDSDVIVGSLRLAPNFYHTYLKEAQQHLATIDSEARAQPAVPPSDEFVRAAHTLASISRTAGFDSIALVAGALETWASRTQRTPNAEQRQPVAAAVTRLREMVDAIERRELPRAADAEVAALRGITKERTLATMLATIRLPRPAVPPAEAHIIARAADGTQQRDPRAIRDDLDLQLLPMFIEEAQHLLPKIGNDLRAWKAGPPDRNVSDSLKRALHTLKGSARMAGAMRLGELIHLMESAVEAAPGTGAPGAAVLDRLEVLMDRLGHDLERLHTPPVETSRDAAPARNKSVVPSPAAMLRIGAEALDRVVNQSGEISIARSRIEIELRELKQSALDLNESIARLRVQLREMEIQADSQMQSRTSARQDDRDDFDPLEFDRYTRLQELTRMMAESLHDAAAVQQALLKNLGEADTALLHQSRVSRDLQQELMRVRTVPFSNLTERLHRIVRQAARELGKRANLEITGGQVEIDRSVLDRIGAPLEHLLRNAVAHGLEGSDQRRRLDKPETGEIAVALRQEGDQIVIEVSDDGAGLDVDKLRRKGLEKGLLQPDDAMDPAKLTQLIFTPGFSTADQVTELSGRGIGLDVVGSEVASIGGRIDTSSTPGKGMRFTIVLPLTLAIMDAVLVRGAQHTFAVPSAMIEQVLRVKAHELAQIEAIGAAEFRGHRYPLRRLPHLLGAAPHTQESQVYQSILLLRNGSHRIALHVDELMRNQEIVIKNIGPQFSRVPWISGATVLADGSIVLIINPVQLAQVARPATAPGQPAEPAATEPRPLVVMVVDDSLTVRKVMGRLLEREGYRVLTAKDGVDALEKLGTTVPDVMLLDIEMPRMDGFELARNVRGNPATAGVPMIMISSRGAAKHRNRALEVGIHAFIGKPYEDSELLARIVEVAGSRGQQVVHH